MDKDTEDLIVLLKRLCKEAADALTEQDAEIEDLRAKHKNRYDQCLALEKENSQLSKDMHKQEVEIERLKRSERRSAQMKSVFYKHMTDRELKGHLKAAEYLKEKKTVKAIDAEIALRALRSERK